MTRQAMKREGFRLLDWLVYLSVPIAGFGVGQAWGLPAGIVAAMVYGVVAVMCLGYLQAKLFPSARQPHSTPSERSGR